MKASEDALSNFDIDGALDELPDSDDNERNDAPAAAPTVPEPKDLPEAHCHTAESGSVCRPLRTLIPAAANFNSGSIPAALAAGLRFLQSCKTYKLVALFVGLARCRLQLIAFFVGFAGFGVLLVVR